MSELNSPVNVLRGVGEKKAALLAKLGITDLRSLLFHFPRGYQNRGNTIDVSEVKDGEIVSLILTVASKPVTAVTRSHRIFTRLTAFDDTGKCNIILFNNRYAEQTFTTGAVFRFFGRAAIENGRPVLSAPLYERVVPEGPPLRAIVPVYPLTAGINQRQLNELITAAFRELGADAFIPLLPDDVRMRRGLCTPREAWLGIHMPKTPEETRRATEYFAYAEMFSFGLGAALAKKGSRQGIARPLAVSDGRMAEFVSALPFSLTDCQRRAIGDIRNDMASGTPMNRILCGDVGSGKTVIAAAAAFISLANGYQAALMAPTEILARQHYADLSPMFERFGISSALLVGSMTAAEKKRVHKGLADGSISFAVGTHALISEGVNFSCCPLVITDEQHRFGVGQRETLSEKGSESVDGQTVRPHTLVMSATPIPRSLAMVLYGNLDRSILDELPPGRQKVDTFVVDSSYGDRLDAFILKRVQAGERCYIVCPAVEKNDASDAEDLVQFGASGNGSLNFADDTPIMKNATDEAERLSKMEGLKVGCVHGRMKSSDKDVVMTAFSRGEINVLVSTTVIEVGVNVPEATLMIVLNAERFGLSQLHQLRGRVGRGKAKSWCVLVSDSKSPEAKDRLGAMHDTNNGFEIAERDLKQRGPGDFIAQNSAGPVRQSGEFGFIFAAGRVNDTDMLNSAFADAASFGESADEDTVKQYMR